jgi:Ran GTPase-activating protein (RanGAP) involved in mRNA processing and transport
LTLSQCQSLNLNKVIISNNNLHDSGASKICNILIKLGINIQVLDLSNNEIGSFGLSALSKILKNSNIRDLNLSGNNLQKGGFSCIFKALSTATKLERLNLSNTKINFKCLLNLVHKKLIFKNLVKLDLSKNNICDSGLEIIAKFINKFFVKIGSLNLSKNNINIDSAIKFINELTNCKKMKIIVWDDEKITTNFKTSHSYRPCKTLTSLNLSYNPIDFYELEKQINL